MSESLTDELVAAFCDCTLPKAQWTHAAHLRVGLWHVLRYPHDEALRLLRDRITAYNIAVGTENTDTTGYHETITRFFVWRIGRFVSRADRMRPIDELADELMQTLADKAAPLAYYSRERLMSVEARRAFVEPDLRPFEA